MECGEFILLCSVIPGKVIQNMSRHRTKNHQNIAHKALDVIQTHRETTQISW